jgi:RNA polymerase sigma-70 factor (ECF subfamily)
MTAPPDRSGLDQLVIAAQQGDHQAFHAVVVAVQHELRLVLCGFAPPPDLLEELMQDTLVTAWGNLASYRPEGTFTAWLHTIARNKARSRWRADRRARPLDSDALETLLAEAEAGILDDEAAAEAETGRLAVCLEQLPPRARELLQRRYVDQIPLLALAQEARKSEQALAALFYRLRARLRECMAARVPS